MSTIGIRLYDMFRKHLPLEDHKAREFVDAIEAMAETKQADKHEHIEQMVQKDIKSLKDYMSKEFEFMDKKFATKDDLAALRTELTRTIYLTSLGQLLAIVASVVSIIMILKK